MFLRQGVILLSHQLKEVWAMDATVFLEIGEYGAAGMYEEPNRSLFYRKSLGIRRFYENCETAIYNGEYLYPSGVVNISMNIRPHYLNGMEIDYAKVAEKNNYAAKVFLTILVMLLLMMMLLMQKIMLLLQICI